MVLTVPKFRREYMGFKPAPMLPTTYPSTYGYFFLIFTPNPYRIDLTLFNVYPPNLTQCPTDHAIPQRASKTPRPHNSLSIPSPCRQLFLRLLLYPHCPYRCGVWDTYNDIITNAIPAHLQPKKRPINGSSILSSQLCCVKMLICISRRQDFGRSTPARHLLKRDVAVQHQQSWSYQSLDSIKYQDSLVSC